MFMLVGSTSVKEAHEGRTAHGARTVSPRPPFRRDHLQASAWRWTVHGLGPGAPPPYHGARSSAQSWHHKRSTRGANYGGHISSRQIGGRRSGTDPRPEHD